MTIIEFINFVFNSLVGEIGLYELPDLASYISSINNWSQLLNPMCICSIIAHVGVFLFIWQILFILPYRFFKRLVRYPSRKGSEF